MVKCWQLQTPVRQTLTLNILILKQMVMLMNTVMAKVKYQQQSQLITEAKSLVHIDTE